MNKLACRMMTVVVYLPYLVAAIILLPFYGFSIFQTFNQIIDNSWNPVDVGEGKT